MEEILSRVCRLQAILGAHKKWNTFVKMIFFLPGSAHSAPQETIPHSSQLSVSELKQLRGPFKYRLKYHQYISDFILRGPYGSFNDGQIPPESPWHESFCFSAAQSMVGNTVLPSWVASKWSSAPHNLISINPKNYLCIIFGAICIFPNTHFYLLNTTLI